MLPTTAKCPICGAPYKVFNMSAADQSACPTCVAIADRKATDPTPDEIERYDRARRRFWR